MPEDSEFQGDVSGTVSAVDEAKSFVTIMCDDGVEREYPAEMVEMR